MQGIHLPICRVVLLFALAGGGCESEAGPPCDGPECPYQQAATPAIDLPLAMREANWDTGSCVHACLVHVLRWQGQYSLANWWRQHHSGGEYAERLNARMEAAGLRYAYTDRGDEKFLEWAMRTRRGAGVTFWPQHAVNLVHLDETQAALLDNNRIETIVWLSREEFIRRWRGYGGWAWTLVYEPPPPRPYY